MTDSPRKPFNLGAKPPERDKDNADFRHPPPNYSRKPPPNLAPPGMSGIKRNQPSKNDGHEPEKPRFALGERGKLKKIFQPIASPNKNKGHEHDH